MPRHWLEMAGSCF